MNIKEIAVEEIELQSYFVEEAISALLHTILFVRAPNLVKPEDYHCQKLSPLTFAKCGPSDVDQTVSECIEILYKSRISVGPQLSKGIILLTFYEKRENKTLFGLLRSEEKITFERWKIPVLINERDFLSSTTASTTTTATTTNPYHSATTTLSVGNPLPSSSSSSSSSKYMTMTNDYDKQLIFDTTRNEVQKRILYIIEMANRAIDHVPPTLYEYEIEVIGPSGEKKETSMVTRLINSPMI